MLVVASQNSAALALGTPVRDGIVFICPTAQLDSLASPIEAWMASLNIGPELWVKSLDKKLGVLRYSLNTPMTDTNTLRLSERPELGIGNETVSLPAAHGNWKSVSTVSRKEIMLALLQHGRATEFRDGECNVQALVDHVLIRQNTVAWAENLNWVWPNGEEAHWNRKFWTRGTPKTSRPLYEAFNDAFINQRRYAIGCYTATKLVMTQGILDYYHRIKQNQEQSAEVEQRLYLDHDPLVGIEPADMWKFEDNFDTATKDQPGKLLRILHGVASGNFVPGDWIYLVNSDKVSSRKIGYEGSNAVYLGRNKFDDYFNDNDHSYTYEQKIDEVYQWRNGVFSRSRDAARIRPLSAADMIKLARPPEKGGLLADIRVVPYLFGYEALPSLQTR